MQETVLIVDDDPDVCEVLRLYLETEGYRVIGVQDEVNAMTAVREQGVDLVILDVRLPGRDGFELCHDLRKVTHVPILFLSGKTNEWDKIIGLSIADDYICKPFSPREVAARVKAHLRRQRLNGEIENIDFEELSFSKIKIDPLLRQVFVHGSLIPLSMKEFELLYVMAREPKRVFSPEELFQLVWVSDSCGTARTVIVHISNLRKKIERNPAKPEFILTVRGKGYKFNATA